jgi:choline-glycine betaine transporter
MNTSESQPSVDWSIFVPAVLVIVIASVPILVWPDAASQLTSGARDSITQNFLWLYLL